MSEKTILIVDDNRVVLKALELQLQSAGYKTLTAADGSAAIETARQQAPGLVIMDINFPPDVGHGGGVAWDGFKIIEWMRRASGVGNTPVIVITADDIERHREHVVAAGAAAIFHKPVEKRLLLEKIAECLEQSSTPTPGDGPTPTLKLA